MWLILKSSLKTKILWFWMMKLLLCKIPSSSLRETFKESWRKASYKATQIKYIDRIKHYKNIWMSKIAILIRLIIYQKGFKIKKMKEKVSIQLKNRPQKLRLMGFARSHLYWRKRRKEITLHKNITSWQDL